MKRSITKMLGTMALIVAGFASATANTTGTQVHELSESEWQNIAEEAEFDEGTNLEAIPALRTINVKALEMDFKSGTQTNLLLNAPFADNEEVGIVVLDQNGNVIHSSAGTYKNMKDLRFADYYSQDMTYVVRVYSSSAVFETKLQVVYR